MKMHGITHIKITVLNDKVIKLLYVPYDLANLVPYTEERTRVEAAGEQGVVEDVWKRRQRT
jgi:hypothetical protein